jgi:hypothetical protein
MRFQTTLDTALDADEAFAYLCDLGNARNWDPAVKHARRLGSADVEEGTAFVVRATLAGHEQELTYRVVEYDPPGAVTFVAETPRLTSTSRLTFESLSASTRVTYSTQLVWRGPLPAAELVLRVAFTRAGERALSGLQRALGPAIPETLASLAGQTLSGEQRDFPRDLEHRLNLLVISFERAQRHTVEGWTPWLDELRRVAEPELAVYELAVLSTRYSPVRRSIDESMARAVAEPSDRARILTVYTDVERATRRLGLADAGTIALVLVDRAGRVLARERGGFDALKARRLIGGQAHRGRRISPVPTPAA